MTSIAMRHERSAGDGVDALARGLGWFSIALGAVQLVAPDAVGRTIGLENRRNMMRACGLREVVTGIGLVAARNPGPWLWARVAGDVVDLALLAPALDRDNPRRVAAGTALGAVAAVAAADAYCASSTRPKVEKPSRDYSDRSGFPSPPSEMRGAVPSLS